MQPVLEENLKMFFSVIDSFPNVLVLFISNIIIWISVWILSQFKLSLLENKFHIFKVI